MVKMRKITNRTLGVEDKMVIFRWMAKRIASNGMHVTWVSGGFGDSQKIKKSTLNFKGKVWWTVA